LGLPDLVWAISAAGARRGDEKAPALLEDLQQSSDDAVLETIFGGDSDFGDCCILLFCGRGGPWNVGRKWRNDG
jgi:hypothetical protein